MISNTAQVMEFNKDACSKRLAILCDAVYPELAGKSEDEKAPSSDFPASSG